MCIGIFSFRAFDRRLARLAAPISSGVRQGGGAESAPPPAGRVRLNTPAGRGLRHFGIPRYECTVDIQVLTSYLLEMQNLSKIKKWQSTVTATAKKIICVQRDVLAGMYALTLHR